MLCRVTRKQAFPYSPWLILTCFGHKSRHGFRYSFRYAWAVMSTDKTLENRLRRMARRQGLDLQKSRRRDPQALDYGGYQLVDRGSSSLVLGEIAGTAFGASLDDIEAFLLRPRVDRPAPRAGSYGQGSAEVVVEHVAVPDWASDLLLQEPERADVLVLPQRVRDGRGEYGIDDLMGVKDLRTAGIRADWAHAEPEDRTFVSEYSADVPVFVTLFVAQSLAQEGVVEVARWLLGRVRQVLTGRTSHKAAAPLVIEVDRVELKENRRVIEGLRVTGHDERVVEVVKTILQGGPASK
jgi:hypothetical protein